MIRAGTVKLGFKYKPSGFESTTVSVMRALNLTHFLRTYAVRSLLGLPMKKDDKARVPSSELCYQRVVPGPAASGSQELVRDPESQAPPWTSGIRIWIIKSGSKSFVSRQRSCMWQHVRSPCQAHPGDLNQGLGLDLSTGIYKFPWVILMYSQGEETGSTYSNQFWSSLSLSHCFLSRIQCFVLCGWEALLVIIISGTWRARNSPSWWGLERVSSEAWKLGAGGLGQKFTKA